MAVFNGYLDNRCDALEKFTKNSDISVASNDFNEAVKQQENLLKEELSFTEKLLLKDFAYKLYGVKMPETKQRIGIDAATQCKISFLLGDISKHKRQIVRNFGEKTWQETFNKFEKTNDLKVFENAVKSQNSTQNFNKNINLQISNKNANLKNPNLQNSAGNANSKNNATNLQNLNNDFKM